MPAKEWKARVADALRAIQAIDDHVSGMGFLEFRADRKTVEAVIYNLLIIGKAADAPAPVRAAHPQAPWKVLDDVRSIAADVRFGVNMDILWDAIQNDLPPLVVVLQNVLRTSEAP